MPGRERVTVRLHGTAPLLMRSARLADPLDPFTIALDRLTRKRAKTCADHHEIARIEFLGGMWTKDGAPCVPGAAVEACLLQAARLRKAGASVKAGVSVAEDPLLEHDGPVDLEALYADQRHVLRVPVRIRGVRTMRTRPRFPRWSLTVSIDHVPGVVGRTDLLDDLVVAGDQIGLGDWRPRHGSFRPEVLGAG